jgi:hypothetical protein
MVLLGQIVILDWRPRRIDVGRCRHLPDAYNPGDSSGEATPVPIPNTEVKLSSAEDTERAAFRENRSSPGLLLLRPCRCAGSSVCPRYPAGHECRRRRRSFSDPCVGCCLQTAGTTEGREGGLGSLSASPVHGRRLAQRLCVPGSPVLGDHSSGSARPLQAASTVSHRGPHWLCDVHRGGRGVVGVRLGRNPAPTVRLASLARGSSDAPGAGAVAWPDGIPARHPGSGRRPGAPGRADGPRVPGARDRTDHDAFDTGPVVSTGQLGWRRRDWRTLGSNGLTGAGAHGCGLRATRDGRGERWALTCILARTINRPETIDGHREPDPGADGSPALYREERGHAERHRRQVRDHGRGHREGKRDLESAADQGGEGPDHSLTHRSWPAHGVWPAEPAAGAAGTGRHLPAAAGGARRATGHAGSARVGAQR